MDLAGFLSVCSSCPGAPARRAGLSLRLGNDVGSNAVLFGQFHHGAVFIQRHKLLVDEVHQIGALAAANAVVLFGQLDLGDDQIGVAGAFADHGARPSAGR